MKLGNERITRVIIDIDDEGDVDFTYNLGGCGDQPFVHSEFELGSDTKEDMLELENEIEDALLLFK